MNDGNGSAEGADMVVDIVTRLERDAERCFITEVVKNYADAIAEIERLRTELKAFEKGYLIIQDDRQHLRKQVVLWQDIAINLAHHSEGWIDGGKAFEDYLDNLEGKAVRGE
jgi:hypothetical protein